MGQQGKLDDAVARVETALRIKPDYAEAHMSRGMAWLLQGKLEQGWPEYEWRWKCKNTKKPPFRQPLWDGSPLEGRSILLHAEQGLGDWRFLLEREDSPWYATMRLVRQKKLGDWGEVFDGMAAELAAKLGTVYHKKIVEIGRDDGPLTPTLSPQRGEGESHQSARQILAVTSDSDASGSNLADALGVHSAVPGLSISEMVDTRRISVITPWRDHPELIEDYERAVRGAEVIVIDNASRPENAALLQAMAARLGGVYSRNQENRGFSAANNQGMQHATGAIFMFLNNDISAKPGFLNMVLRAATRDQFAPADWDMASLTAELKTVNEHLWEIEDRIRVCDRNGDFGPQFIELARSVYRQNDQRAELKRRINLRLGSRLLEEKSAWFKKGSGTVAGTARRVLRTTVPDPFLNHAEKSCADY